MATQSKQPIRLLIIRNDKLGDFMLAWPVFALLKQHWPEVHITVLVPPYTEAMARLCPWIDAVILDENESALALARKFRKHHYDAVLTLFSTSRVAFANWISRIPYRLAPATKVAQYFYNHRLLQRRSRSEKPEYAYNLDLAYQLLADFVKYPLQVTATDEIGEYLPSEINRPLLQPIGEKDRTAFARLNKLNTDTLWIVVHPGSGGSANNLTPSQYSQLALTIHSATPLTFIISAGPGEEITAGLVAEKINQGGGKAVVHASTEINLLVETLQWADLYISGSTGPLHIAAALNRRTAAFYPRHRSATALRWQTLNASDRRLAFEPPKNAAMDSVKETNIIEAANIISERFLY